MELVLHTPSNFVTVVNFLIFEVLLISLVFLFTTDISARLNYLSIIDGSSKPLHVISPPILGGGLCSTSRNRALTMLAIRAVAVTLILGASLTIDGDKKSVIDTRTALIRVPGYIPSSLTIEGFAEAISNRSSCQVTKDGYIYHGILYANGFCESDISVLQNTIRVHGKPEPISFSLPNCQSKPFEHTKNRIVHWFDCAQSRIACFVSGSSSITADSCIGTVKTANASYMCNQFISREGDRWEGRCHRAFNLEISKDFWIRSWEKSGANIFDVIGATTVLSQNEQRVKYVRDDYVTNIKYL